MDSRSLDPQAMALFPPLGLSHPPELLTHPCGELDSAGSTDYPASGAETIRSEQALKLGQDSLDAPELTQAEQRGAEPTASPMSSFTPSSREDSAGNKHHEYPISGLEVLEAEQDSLYLCLLGLGLRLQDLERSLRPWTLAQSMTVRLQALQADLHGAAERVDALLAFGEGLAQRSEPRSWASLEHILRALGAHRDTIFRRLWQLQAQLVSYSLVFEEANMLDQDLEAKGDSDGPGTTGIWGPWTSSSLLTPAELEWDPAGDVGGLGPLRQRKAWTPGAPCELCGHRGQAFEDMFMSGLGHRKHLAGHRRRPLLRKPQDKKRQAAPSLQGVMLEVDSGVPTPTSRRPLLFLLILLVLFLLLLGATLFLPISGGPCCSHTRLARTPYLVLSYVNGPPPI